MEVDLKYLLRKVPVILLSDLGLICGTIKDGSIVIDVLDLDEHCCVVLVEVI